MKELYTQTNRLFLEESVVNSFDDSEKRLVELTESLRQMTNRTESIEKIQKAVIQKIGCDEKELKSLRSTMRPFVESALEKSITRKELDFLDIVSSAFEDIIRGLDYAYKIGSMSQKRVAKKQRSIFNLLGYLLLSEGVYCEAVQLISFILLENCHDLYDHRRMKFAKTYDDLDEIDMFVKLQFLEQHGFKSVVGAFDRKLRNVIAHQKFIVQDNGDIVNSRTHKKIADSKSILEKLWKLLRVSTASTYAISSEIFSSSARIAEKEKLAIEKARASMKNPTN
jgi:hypothetical protein